MNGPILYPNHDLAYADLIVSGFCLLLTYSLILMALAGVSQIVGIAEEEKKEDKTETDARLILEFLKKKSKEGMYMEGIAGQELREAYLYFSDNTILFSAYEINDAVGWLENRGWVKIGLEHADKPYFNFGKVGITPEGIREYERMRGILLE